MIRAQVFAARYIVLSTFFCIASLSQAISAPQDPVTVPRATMEEFTLFKQQFENWDTWKVSYRYEARTFFPLDAVKEVTPDGKPRIIDTSSKVNGEPTEVLGEFTEDGKQVFFAAHGHYVIYFDGSRRRIEYTDAETKARTETVIDGDSTFAIAVRPDGLRRKLPKGAVENVEHYSPLDHLRISQSLLNSSSFVTSDDGINFRHKNPSVGTTFEIHSRSNPLIKRFSTASADKPAGTIDEYSDWHSFQGIFLPGKVIRKNYNLDGDPIVFFLYTDIQYSKVESPPTDLFTLE